MDVEGSESEMAKSGSLACLSKKTISTLFESIISCKIFVAAIYIILSLLSIASIIRVDSLFIPVGYISLIILFSAPIALYGSTKNSYYALFLFFVLASYHLYALLIYVWLNIRSSSFLSGNNNSTSGSKDNRFGELPLHQVTLAAYTMAVILSLIVVCLKIVSSTSQIVPTRVILVDNNPSE